MLLNVKIVKMLEGEVKAQEKFKKTLEEQEKNYDVDYSERKADIDASIKFMKDVINNGK